MFNRREFIKNLTLSGITLSQGAFFITISNFLERFKFLNPVSDLQRKVGIFFLVDNEILVDAVPISKGLQNGELIQYGSHHDFWKCLVPKTETEKSFKARPYNSFQRGRVDYLYKEAKPCVCGNNLIEIRLLEIVFNKFNIDDVCLFWCGNNMTKKDI